MKKQFFISSNYSIKENYNFSVNDRKEVSCVKFSACLFSTANNRNKAYFQVSKLLKERERLAKMLTSLNHDLKITGNKYMSNQTVYNNLQAKFVGDELEIWVDVKSTDVDFIKVIDSITAPSIELYVEEENIIRSENGEYLIDFEWAGISWLLGVAAGSGDARIESIVKYEENNNNNNNLNKINMNEQQIKELLIAQKNELIKEFEAKNEALKIEFNKTIAENKNSENGEYTFTNEKGETCKTSWSSIYKSITEIVENNNISDDNSLVLMMKAKNFKLVKEESKDEDIVSNTAKNIAKAEAFAQKMTQVRTEEDLEGNLDDSAKTKDTSDINFNLAVKKAIEENINVM